jgi:hypothetical protein
MGEVTGPVSISVLKRKIPATAATPCYLLRLAPTAGSVVPPGQPGRRIAGREGESPRTERGIVGREGESPETELGIERESIKKNM